jgi:hypothetical protein
MPYTNLFDNKPPGLYLLNAAGEIVLPWLDPWIVTWILTLAFTAATALVVDLFLRRRLPPAGSYAMAALCAVGIAAHAIAYGGGLTESFAVLPLVICLLAFDRLEPSRRRGLPGRPGLLDVDPCRPHRRDPGRGRDRRRPYLG